MVIAQCSRNKIQWMFLSLVCVMLLSGGCDNSGKQMKLPSLEGAPEAMGAPKNK